MCGSTAMNIWPISTLLGRVAARSRGRSSEKTIGAGLITDCYSGYDRHATLLKQKCLSHVKRSAEDSGKLLPPEAVQSRAFFDAVTQWVKRGCKWYRKNKNGRVLPKTTKPNGCAGSWAG